jgi:alpha-ribazole phosphatase
MVDGYTGGCLGATQQVCEVIFLPINYCFMEVYLVRHTETVCAKDCYEQSDVAIAEPYLPIFENIKEQLPIDATYYSSPLVRSNVSGTPFNRSDNDHLMEMNFGDWELQRWDDIPEVRPQSWMIFVNIEFNGESFIEVHHRVLSFFKINFQGNPNQ